jgi:hypothetical protein
MKLERVIKITRNEIKNREYAERNGIPKLR